MRTFKIKATSGKSTIHKLHKEGRLFGSVSNHVGVKLSSVCERSGPIEVKMVKIRKCPSRRLNAGLRQGSLTEHQLIQFLTQWSMGLTDFQLLVPIKIGNTELIADVRIFCHDGRYKQCGVHLFERSHLVRGPWIFFMNKSNT